jgi:hypothetical protein
MSKFKIYCTNLGTWIIWKHRNACVFERVSPLISMIWSKLKNERSLWSMAGAKKLQGLGLALAAVFLAKVESCLFTTCLHHESV